MKTSAFKCIPELSSGRSRRCSMFLFLLGSAFLWQPMFWLNWDLIGRPYYGGTHSYSWLSVEDLAREGDFTLASTNTSAPLLVVHCYSSLSNRLQALASAMAIASATGRQLQVVWIPDVQMQAKFHDLFENAFVVWDSLMAVTSRPDWPEFDKYNYGENEEGSEKNMYINVTSPAHIYAKSAYTLAHVSATEEEVAHQFNKLVPSKTVRRYLQPFRSEMCQGWAPCSAYIGVHFWHANPLTEPKGGELKMHTNDWLNMTAGMGQMLHPVHFVSEVKKVLAKREWMQVFVSTDSHKALKPFIEAFGDRVLFLHKQGCLVQCANLNKQGCCVGSPQCTKLALAELLILGHSSHDYILGSYWSSFLEVARYPRSVKVKYAGVDFVAPGMHAHKCGAEQLDLMGTFTGVAVVAAVQGMADVLHHTVPTWLAEEGVSEVILVDWGSDPPLSNTLKINDTRLRIVKVEGVESWIVTRAFNIGFRHSSASAILKMDGDMEMYPGALEAHPLKVGMYYAGKWEAAKNNDGCHQSRIFYIHREDLMRVNGFDERIETYGWHDEDISGRLGNIGVKQKDLRLEYFHQVEHAEPQRTQHSSSVYNCNDVESQRNKLLLQELPPLGLNLSTVELKCNEAEQLTCHCTIVTSPMGLVHYIPPKLHEEISLSAYRTVVGSIGNFEAHVLEEVMSLKWYEAFLQRHFHPMDRYLVVMPRGSIAERLVGLQCALDLAQRWGWNVHVAWKQEQPCMHAFEDLFSNNTLEVVPDFYNFEIDWRYQALYLDHGTDWISEATEAPKGQKNLLVVTQGAFGQCRSSVSGTLWNSLAPTKLGQSLQPSLNSKIPTAPALILKLKGTMIQRIYALASAIQLGQNFSRHIVLVWDPAYVGGLLLSDIFSNPVHEVASLQDYLDSTKGGGMKTYVHNETGSVKGIDWSRRENVVVELTGRLVEKVRQDDFNDVLKGLVPSQQLIDEQMALQVGNGFHGFLIGKNWDGCKAKGAITALKAAYRENNQTSKAPLFVLSEDQEVCKEAGQDIICVTMCGPRLSKTCLMRHLAAVLLLSKLPRFFFLDWAHEDIDFIMRQGQKNLRRVRCSYNPHDNNNNNNINNNNVPMSLARELNARILAKALERTHDSCDGSWHLMLQIPIMPEVHEDNKLRNVEYMHALVKNLNHPEVKKIHIFCDSVTDEARIRTHMLKDPCKKLEFVSLGRRLLYNDTFEYANEHLEGEACAVLNADIYLGEGFGALDMELHLPVNRVLALSRFEKEEGELCGYSMCTRYKNKWDGYLSHDTFLFRPPLPSDVISRTGFFQQTGSENVLIHIMKQFKIEVRNPCRTLKTYHNHCSGIRQWRMNETSRSWEKSLSMSERIDIKYCNEVHCGDGWVQQGPEVIQDLE